MEAFGDSCDVLFGGQEQKPIGLGSIGVVRRRNRGEQVRVLELQWQAAPRKFCCPSVVAFRDVSCWFAMAAGCACALGAQSACQCEILRSRPW
jgi:hypothetical protein